MGVAIFLTVSLIVLYIGYGATIGNYKRELRTILFNSMVVGIFIVWATYILVFFLNEYSKLELYIYPIFLAVAGLTIYKIYQISKTKPLEIVAKQQTYWGVSIDDIYSKNNWKLDFKKDRVEMIVNPLSKQLYRTYGNEGSFITGNVFLAMKNLELTKASNIEEIESELYRKLISKFQEIISNLELDDDLNEILKSNDNIVEYFLIDCWRLYTKRVNLGIATLNAVAKNFTEIELLGALDNATLQSVKRNGAGLFFLYAEYKKELPKVESKRIIKVSDEEDEDF